MSITAKLRQLFLLLAVIISGCTKYEHAKSVTLYNFKGQSNMVFTDVTILERRSNYIYFVSEPDEAPTQFKGRYTVEK